MSFQWRRDRHRDRWVYDETWAVELQGGRWFVLRDGRALLEDHPSPGAAMEAAERAMAL